MGAGGDAAAGFERLNALFILGDVMGGDVRVLTGAAGVGAGMERSKRSFMPEAGAAGLAGADVVGVVNDAKSPMPVAVLEICLCVWAWGGGCFGAEPKKLPPPPNIVDD